MRPEFRNGNVVEYVVNLPYLMVRKCGNARIVNVVKNVVNLPHSLPRVKKDYVGWLGSEAEGGRQEV